jgi:soluble lytic murein transglycosylase-like protein
MRLVPLWGGFPIHSVSLAAALVLSGCTSPTIYHINTRPIAPPQLERAFNIALSWPSPADIDALQGAFLIRDGPTVDAAELAIARAILRTNPRLQPAYALLFAGATTRAARSHLLPPEFLGATLLQESAYDPQALSTAGAIGIAQFMPETAAGVGVNPYDPFESIEAAAALIAGYVDAYQGRYADPYSAALAAYNAGPFAVARYRGVPPYAETREYIALIYDRWARIVSYERTGGD